jgi:hypothetical protein
MKAEEAELTSLYINPAVWRSEYCLNGDIPIDATGQSKTSSFLFESFSPCIVKIHEERKQNQTLLHSQAIHGVHHFVVVLHIPVHPHIAHHPAL